MTPNRIHSFPLNYQNISLLNVNIYTVKYTWNSLYINSSSYTQLQQYSSCLKKIPKNLIFFFLPQSIHFFANQTGFIVKFSPPNHQSCMLFQDFYLGLFYNVTYFLDRKIHNHRLVNLSSWNINACRSWGVSQTQKPDECRKLKQ